MRSARRTRNAARLSSVLAVSVVLVLSASSWVAADSSGLQVPPGDITGTVTDVDGVTPLVGAPVVLMNLADGQELQSAVTDSDGTYVLADVPTGVFTLQIAEPGIKADLEVATDAEQVTVNAVVPALLVAPAPAGAPPGVTVSPIPATIISGPGSVMLMPTCASPPTGPAAMSPAPSPMSAPPLVLLAPPAFPPCPPPLNPPFISVTRP